MASYYGEGSVAWKSRGVTLELVSFLPRPLRNVAHYQSLKFKPFRYRLCKTLAQEGPLSFHRLLESKRLSKHLPIEKRILTLVLRVCSFMGRLTGKGLIA